jgi:hypothetical protein
LAQLILLDLRRDTFSSETSDLTSPVVVRYGSEIPSIFTPGFGLDVVVVLCIGLSASSTLLKFTAQTAEQNVRKMENENQALNGRLDRPGKQTYFNEDETKSRILQAF